jgi:TonB family protein
MGGRTNDPYFNPRRTRNILFGVLLVHIGVIAVPLIYSSLSDYFDPPLVVMKVGLADLPLGDSPDAGQPTQADTPAKTDPAPVDDIPDPTNVDPLPPEPKVQPKVEQKVDPPPQPKVDPPKPKVDPPKNTQAKVDPPKPKVEQKKDPPKSNILKPQDIIIPKTTKTQAQIKAEQDAARAAEEARRKADKARQELIAGIRQAAGSQPGKFGTTDPGQDGILATKEMRAYYELLIAFIQPRWNAVSPSSIELNGKISNWPTIQLTIEKNGSVSASAVVSASGNKKLDDAARALLAELKAVPVPPQAVKIPITLDIR